MSLINQMLQELDARRSEIGGADAYGQQIRAVPKKSGVNAAWWIVLVLGLVLTGGAAWTFLYLPQFNSKPHTQALQPAQIVVAPTPAVVSALMPPLSQELPLKLSTDLSVAQLVSVPDTARQPIEELSPASSAPPLTVATAKQELAGNTASHHRAVAVKPETVVIASNSATEKKEPVSKAVHTVSFPKEETVVIPHPVKPAMPAQLIAPSLETTSAVRSDQAVEAPIVVNKHVKELTLRQRAENEYRRATVLIQQGRSTEAVTHLEQALGLDSRHAAARQTLIGVLVESKRLDDALRLAREGIAGDPAQTGLAMILARLQLEKGELRSAIESLQRTLPYAAERSDYQAFLAALLQRDSRHKEAVEQYMAALRKSSHNGVWWMGLGISLQAENRIAEAREAYQRANTSASLSPELTEFVDGKLKQLSR